MMESFPDNFAHLEVHSHYTLLGGTASVQQLVAQAAADDLPALALTDTNGLYGIVQFCQLCEEYNIKPIIGMAIDVHVPTGILPPQRVKNGRLVLLADGLEGYRSLCRLSSLVHDKKNGEAPGVSWQTLGNQRQGLICLSGGRLGWIEQLVRAGQLSMAARVTAQLGGMFDQRCFLSISPRTKSDPVAREISNLGQRFGLPVTAVQPIFCLRPDESSRFQLLAAIDQNCAIDEVADYSLPNLGDGSIPIHWPEKEDFVDRFAEYPQALDSVAEIVQRCRPGLPDGRPIWPVLQLPGRQTAENALRKLARSGLKEKYGSSARGEIETRLQKELEIIITRGFAPLFIIVADIVRYARQESIPVSTRGSVANSLVAYCCGISQVDPIAQDLLFERFLNPERSSLPDIDLDFCSRRRDEILEFVRQTYGEEKVALVSTMNTLQPRSALRETAKAYGLQEKQLKKLSTKMPRRWHPDPQRRQKLENGDLLAGIDDPLEAEVLQRALEIVGQPHHLSIHPGGLVITPGLLTDTVPIQKAPKGFLITQFDHRDIERVGLPKLDLLGIRALTVMADAEELIRSNRDPQFSLIHVPLDDRKTADLIASGDTIGVFQCESVGARRTLRKLQAQNIGDLAVANAFFKPGPATGGMAQSFVKRYRGEEKMRFLHPSLEPILGSTQGVLLFQEQILRIAREIAGLSWSQADGLRKGMSKFQPQEMSALTIAFLTGCQRQPPQGPGFSMEQAKTLWEQVKAFAGYGFNKGHATAYADVSYRSAYLKAHFAAEFLCARLADRGGFHHPAIYIAEAQRLGINVRPPHVNFSEKRFKLLPSDQSAQVDQLPPKDILWMGLGQVRDLRSKTINAIIAERENQTYSDLPDFLSRITLQEKEVLHLIRCGALDGMGKSRAAMLAEASHIRRAGSSRQLAFDFARVEVDEFESPQERWRWELELLGIPLSVRPEEVMKRKDENAVQIDKLPDLEGELVTIQGFKLPGWTGDKGFFFGDGREFILAYRPRRSQLTSDQYKLWEPMTIKGRWQEDEWGLGSFHIL